jgi:hypothetical protein
VFYPIRCRPCAGGFDYDDGGYPETLYINPDDIDMVYSESDFDVDGRAWIVHPDDVELFKQMILDNRVQGIWQESDKKGYPLAFDYREG